MATHDGCCPRCHDSPETVMLVIRDCEEVHDFWYSVINSIHVSRFFSLSLERWLDFNLTNEQAGFANSTWQTFFGSAIYELLRDRKWLVFSHSTVLGQGYDSLWRLSLNLL